MAVDQRMVLQAAADHHDPTVGIEQPRRAILRLAQYRRVAAVVQRVLHRGADFGESAQDDLRADRIDFHRHAPVSTTNVPERSTVARWPGQMTLVESNCSTIAGPTSSSPCNSLSR